MTRDDVPETIGARMQRRAPRLKYSVLEMRALREAGFALPRPWQDALREYVRTLSLA